MGKTPDLTGQEFGRLKVLSFAGSDKNGRSYWLCQCKCGTEKEISAGHLRDERTQSCGCLRIEASSKQMRMMHIQQTVHGLSKTKTYKSWDSMMARCTIATAPNYSAYGGRGITVCDRWLLFENYLSDMGERPDGLSIDRIDNEGNYEPGNCRWATPSEQSSNRRTSRHIVVNGERMNVAEAARRSGLDRGVIRSRLDIGWSVEKALATPVRYCRRRKSF